MLFLNLFAINPLASILSLAILIIIGLIAVAFLFFSIIPVLRGAPFVPIHRQRLVRALEFLNLKPDQKAADLGSGDGRVLIEIAKKGVKSIGYEINPFLVLKTKMEVKKQGLGSLVSCHWKSFWGVNFNQFDAVFIFGISHIMKGIEKKAQKELKAGARLVCFVFPLPPHQTRLPSQRPLRRLWSLLWCGGSPPHQTKLWCGGEPNWQPIFAENGVYVYQKQ